MLENLWNMNELESITLRPIKERTIGNRTFEAYEPLLYLNSANFAAIDLPTTSADSRGGKGNFSKVSWTKIASVDVVISKGKISDVGFTMLTNTVSKDYPGYTPYYINAKETKTTDASGRCTLANVPRIDGALKMFVYDLEGSENLEKKTASVISGSIIDVIDGENTTVLVDYYYDYNDGTVTELRIQEDYFKGFYQLEGKTRVIDDDGNERSMFIVLPKIQLKSALSIRLGAGQSPGMADFQFTALSGEYNGETAPMFFQLLSDTVD